MGSKKREKPELLLPSISLFGRVAGWGAFILCLIAVFVIPGIKSLDTVAFKVLAGAGAGAMALACAIEATSWVRVSKTGLEWRMFLRGHSLAFNEIERVKGAREFVSVVTFCVELSLLGRNGRPYKVFFPSRKEALRVLHKIDVHVPGSSSVEFVERYLG